MGTDSPTSGSEPQMPTPGMMGDPHLMTWNGEYFDYMGECDLVLLRVPNFNNDADMTVHVRTTIRYDYSFISQAAIRIGSDTLEVSAFGSYAFNSVEGAVMNPLFSKKTNFRSARKVNAVSYIGGYPIVHTQDDSKKQHSFDIVLADHQNITISVLKDIVSVRVHNANPDSFSNVEGFLGNSKGDMLARDGVTDLGGDMNEMADEWQVRDTDSILFETNRAPQYPNRCRLPDEQSKESRRLGAGILEEEAKTACAHVKGNARAFAACIYDVTATNDLDQAGAY